MADFNPKHLTPNQRAKLWEGIQKHLPELAALLKKDEFKALKTEFNGTVIFDDELLKPALDYMRANT